jgi:hypothetical protein
MSEPVNTAALRVWARAFPPVLALCDEVDRLRAEVVPARAYAEAVRQVNELCDERDEARAALDRVRAEHSRITDPAGGDDYCRDCQNFWPCPTIRAIGPQPE